MGDSEKNGFKGYVQNEFLAKKKKKSLRDVHKLITLTENNHLTVPSLVSTAS